VIKDVSLRLNKLIFKYRQPWLSMEKLKLTTIQISKELQKKPEKRKISTRESYEEVIESLLEDTMEISEETKKELERARKEVKSGKVKPLSKIKKELKLY
jgi:hypothetical protein